MATKQRPPYILGDWIRDPKDFYGRDLQLEDAFDCIYKGQCVSIVGDRRIGKTSFLRYLLQPQVQEEYDCAGDDLVYIYMDPQIIWPQTPTAFFRTLLDELDRHPAVTLPEITADPDENDVLRMLQMGRSWRPIVLIDEFEALTYCDQYPDGFYEFLRGCAVNYNLTLVTASSCTLRECCPQKIASSPFPNMFYIVALYPFTQEELLDFVVETSERSGIDLEPFVSDIDAMVGRFPYLVQLACMAYYKRISAGEAVDASLNEHVLFDVLQQADHYYRHLWESDLNTPEREILTSVMRQRDLPQGSGTFVTALENKGHLRNMRIGSQALHHFLSSHLGQRQAETKAPTQSPDAIESQENMGIWIDNDTQIAYRDASPLELTNLEFRLLQVLWENKGGICDSYMIVEQVWGGDYVEDVDDQRISALVSRLRRKVEPSRQRPWKYICTVHGRGLKLGDNGA